ncbi:hypothetical protein V8E55_010492 [Tylopilus felleus]
MKIDALLVSPAVWMLCLRCVHQIYIPYPKTLFARCEYVLVTMRTPDRPWSILSRRSLHEGARHQPNERPCC